MIPSIWSMILLPKDKVERQAMDLDNDEKKISKLNEEINLLYVAATRTKNIIHIPEELLPKDFPKFPQIKVIKKKSQKKLNLLLSIRLYQNQIFQNIPVPKVKLFC
jgi:ATP-dependent exoDNAse (exonuclease V) beta subunit